MVRQLSTVVGFVGAIAAGSALTAHASTPVAVAIGATADSVTGCLQKGNAKDTYSITDAAGKKHWVTSKNLPLDKHVGHTVTLSGAAAAPMSSDKMADTGMKMGKMDNSMPMDVTAMTMVSTSCK